MNGKSKASHAADRRPAAPARWKVWVKRMLICCLALALLLPAGCNSESEKESVGSGQGGALLGRDTSDNDSAQGGGTPDEDTPDSASAEDFYGCWEYADWGYWLTVYEDGTYTLLDASGSGATGGYYMEDDALCLDDDSFRFYLDGEGGLVDSDGDALFPSDPPDGTEEPDETQTPDDREEPENRQPGAEEFFGCWEYQEVYEWLYIHEDGTYDWYDADGYSHSGSYVMQGDALCLDGDGMSYVVKDGGIVDDDGDLMYRSMLPDYDGTATAGAEEFFGCWESISGGVWLTIYDDGTYLWMWDDGYGSAGRYYMEGDVLCLQSGTRLELNDESGFLESEDDVLFPSEMPAHLQ